MTKQWLMRRAVRSPVSRLTTAAISSSVCRLPFISASALPSRTSCDGLRRRTPGCAARRRSAGPRCRCRTARATASMRAAGPTRIGAISPSLRRLDRAAQRALVARMRDRGRRRRQAPCRSRSAARTSRASRCHGTLLRPLERCATLARLPPSRHRLGARALGACSTSPMSLDHRHLLGRGLARAARARRRASRRSSVSKRSRSARSRSSFGKRRERLLRFVAHDDLLLAADRGATRPARTSGRRSRVFGHQLLLHLQARRAAAARPCARAGTRRARAPPR